MPAAHRGIRTCAALLSILSLVACGNAPQRSAQSARETAGRPATANPAPPLRSERGNPPFYDVLGKRYHVLPTNAGYVQRGVASWYGRDFHGLATSSGEQYDMHAMTAAHTTLPLPTWVEVTNLVNGKRVVVKVNDRGPFVDNRLIDLSFAAATELDMVRTGTTRVEVRAIAPPLDSFRAGSTVAALPQPSSGCSCRLARSRSRRTRSVWPHACVPAVLQTQPSSARLTTAAGCTACCWGRSPTPASSIS
jgi:rare lipoprotein A